MRDSLNAGPLSRRGERSSRQKRLTPSEMPIAPGKKKDRGRARVASPPGQQRKSDPDDRASSSSRKRPRVLAQMGGGSSRLQRPDPSISPPPTRKRGRPTNEERLRRENDCGRPASQGRGQRSLPVGAARSSLPRSNASGVSDRRAVESLPSRLDAASSASTAAAAAAAVSSIPAATATSAVSSSFPSWPFQQQPQRLTRTRPVDQDRMMQVFIGEGPSKGPRSGSGSSSSSSSNTSTSDLGEAVQTLEAFAHQRSGGSSRDNTQGVATSASSRNGGARHGSSGTAGVSRRHGGRCGAAGAHARGTSASPGRRGSAASAAAVAAAPPAAAAAAGGTAGGSVAQAKAGPTGPNDHVIVPKFRLHNLFSDSSAPGGGEAPGGVDMTIPGTGSRRKRPAGLKAAAASGAASIAPPQPPRGGRETGFLALTKDSLVRSSHTAVFGSDYDLDYEDCAFLEQLNAVSSASSGGGGGSNAGEGGVNANTNRPVRNRSARNQGGAGGEGGSSEAKGCIISEELFEAMIEKLERQESRARDVRVRVVIYQVPVYIFQHACDTYDGTK